MLLMRICRLGSRHILIISTRSVYSFMTDILGNILMLLDMMDALIVMVISISALNRLMMRSIILIGLIQNLLISFLVFNKKAFIHAGKFDEKSAAILKGVGGVANLVDIDCCATRLRLTLVDSGKVSESVLKATGASGVVVKGAGIQVIYGPSVTIVKSNFEEFVDQVRSGEIQGKDFMDVQTPEQVAAVSEKKADADKPGTVLGAHLNGKAIPLSEVQDEAFACRALGDGAAIEPSEGKLYAPASKLYLTQSMPLV